MSTSVVNPIEKARLSIYKKMSPALQEVAKTFEEKLGKGATAIVVIMYDMGSRLKEVVDDEGTYGSGAVKQLADYHGIPGGETMLYGMMNLSKAFDKEYVKTNSLRPMANGHYMTLGHWLHLMKIQDDTKREKMLERVLRESISANDLEKEIRAGAAGGTKNARQGGRKPKAPSSPIMGLQKTFELANKFVRWDDVAQTAVFDNIDEMEPDKVTDNLLAKAKTTLEMVEKVGETAESMKTHLEANIERIEKVLESKAENAAEEYDEEEADQKPKKKAKAAKPSENGKAEKDGKKKKKKKVAVEAGTED